MDEINKIWPKWTTVSRIGKGGFGSVYKVKRETFDSVSYGAVKVIKIPSDEMEVDEMTSSGLSQESIKHYFKDMVQQLHSEIKLMEKLKSANNVVHIEDYDIIENEEGIGWTVYIRMELLTNLNDYLKEHALDSKGVATLGIQILKALEYCQQYNIIHRDIKPGNIFVTEFGEYKLGDFGVSRESEKTNATLSQKGTKSYMAPEMVRMEKYGRTVDLYALGLTMYEILNHGRMPFLPPYPQPFFPKDREEAILRRLVGEDLPSIEGVDEELNNILRKACQANAKDRYQSATEMKEDLEKWMTSDKTIVPIIPVVTDLTEEKTVGIQTSTIFDNPKEEIIIDEEKTVGTFNATTLFFEEGTESKEEVIIEENKEEPMVKEEVIEEETVIASSTVNEEEKDDDNEVFAAVPPKKNNKNLLIFGLIALLVIGVGAGGMMISGQDKDNEPPVTDNTDDTEETNKISNDDAQTTTDDEVSSNDTSSENKPSSSDTNSTSKPSSSSTTVKNWSDWTDTLPSGVTSSNYYIEEQTRYSYRSKETTSSTESSLSGWTQVSSDVTYGEWSEWSSWRKFNPLNIEDIKAKASDTCKVNIEQDLSLTNMYGRYQTATRTKTTTYTYVRYGEWSSYSTAAVSESATQEVRTKTYYRYKEK